MMRSMPTLMSDDDLRRADDDVFDVVSLSCKGQQAERLSRLNTDTLY